MVRFIDIMGSLARVLPESSKPDRKVNLREKIVWTALALTLFLVMSEIPLYPIPTTTNPQDPLFFLRLIFASNRGTLMELGIGPIVTAGLIMQLLSGSKMIDVNLEESKDRGLFTSSQKTMAILIAVVEAAAYILGGAYTNVGVTTNEAKLAVFAQLIMASVFVILVDEMVQKGWGLGSGVSLFIAAGVCRNIFWDLLGPVPAPGESGTAFGVIIALVQYVQNGSILSAFVRPGQNPSLVGLFAMIIVFLIVIYFEGMRLEIPVAYAKYRGMHAKIPLKFLYVSNIPVILASALFANVYFFSYILWQRYNSDNSNFFLNLLARYNTTAGTSSQPPPLPGNLVYYLTPARSVSQVAADPLQALIYVLILCTLCIFFAKTWVEAGGLSARDQANQLVGAGLQIPGFRNSASVLETYLKRYVATLTVVSGLIVGLLAGLSDMVGAIGTGIGILLTVGIVYQYYEILLKEQMLEEYPLVKRVFGEA